MRHVIGGKALCLAAVLAFAGCDQPASVVAQPDADNAADCTSVIVPAHTGWVVDKADMIDATDEATLTQALASYHAKSGHQAAVVTIPDLAGHDVSDVSTCIANSWALGNAERDDGILVLLARDDRKMRVSLGYGLEADGGNERAQQVIDAMEPHFRRGAFGTGVLNGVTTIEEVFP